jgi:hypothetical protein
MSINSERAAMASMFEQVATARETAPQVADDLRYTAAAECIHHIAATFDQISDDALVRLATANTVCDGALGRLITARLLALGFELPPCDDALAFFAPIMREAERTLHQSRHRLH